MESLYLTVGGLRLHLLDYHGTGAPLICIHGLTGNAHNFDALAPHLTPRWRVRSLDVRGRGDSAWGPPADYNPATYVSDLIGVLDTLGLAQVSLIGTSMGGIISMMLAGGYPERVARLVLNDVGPEVEPTGLNRITTYLTTAPASFPDLAAVADYYRENYPYLRATPQAELLDFVKWSVRPGPDGSLVWKMDPAIRNPPRTGTAARPLDLWVPYTRIVAPVLVLRGAESDILSRATTERMRVVQRRTTVVEIPGVGHAPSLVEPQSLAALQDFLG
ncbi:MAG TPA: alpha/beta hydrolase [Candidatus Binataceae bacterium]|nr:alpha/beta hydrolase [Candidatus Binataceae bacterium]